MRSRKRRIVLTILVVLIAPLLMWAVAGFILFSRYVETVEADAAAAEREFVSAHARLPERPALLQYGFGGPVVRRDPQAPVQELQAVHILAYDADAGELTRGTFPVSVIRLFTLGGRINLIGSSIPGSEDRLTLEDLERYGPGLVLDSGKGMPGAVVVADALFGMNSGSRLLVWTE